jgi:hypothetical protein
MKVLDGKRFQNRPVSLMLNTKFGGYQPRSIMVLICSGNSVTACTSALAILPVMRML